MATEMNLGQFLASKSELQVKGARVSFCAWLDARFGAERAGEWFPFPRHTWERYHYMWATGAAPAAKVGASAQGWR